MMVNDSSWGDIAWWFGTMEFYEFPYFGYVIIPTDELHDFSEG